MDPALAEDVTPEHLYWNRRRFIKGLGALAASSVLAGCALPMGEVPPLPGADAEGGMATPSQQQDEMGNSLTPYASVVGYNNYYEFSLNKGGIGELAQGFATSPWSIVVGGLVAKPRTFSVDEVRRLGEEERVYRLRCVEAWSMVIPWLGVPLKRLLEEVGPTADARYVLFTAILAPDEMPGQKGGLFAWPYVEGLRLDEAMHDLTLLATGLYGKPLPVQNGAPLRLVVPWKYGFKYIKAIVKIELVADQPTTFWMASGPGEYGFYANVNPDVPHPRWSQAYERRIGESGRRQTLPFNGYGEQVAHLYAGMDLKVNY